MILPAHWERSTQPSLPFTWTKALKPHMSLDAAGLVALADLTTIARRTALTGTSVLLDTLVLSPGLHRQQDAPDLNGGEYPAVAAMTSGYVFRVENPATVLFLQKVGRTGELTELAVSGLRSRGTWMTRCCRLFYLFEKASLISTAAYFTTVAITITAFVLLAISDNWWGLAVISMLIFARLCNVVVIRRRSAVGWIGASEPGVNGDLLVLLSQDRWIRIRGDVDDLKAVTSGQWLRDISFLESSITAFATVLVYMDAALASNVDQSGKVVLLIVLITSAGLLAIANERTEVLQMHGRTVEVVGKRKKYGRRLDMAKELVKISGRSDWAMRLGMMIPKDAEQKEKLSQQGAEGVIM